MTTPREAKLVPVELLPCPFCGSQAEIETDSDHHGEWFNLGCSKHWGKVKESPCAAGRMWYTETEVPLAKAVEIWNRRALPSSANDRDGERYRWLRDIAQQNTAYDVYGGGGHWSIGFHSPDSSLDLDAAIDKAMND